MSGGTIISLAGRTIVMGRHSNLGPIDPQIGGRPAIAILKEFERARDDIIQNPNTALLWQPILQHYGPTLLSGASQGILWAREIGRKTLREGMFTDDPDADAIADTIVDFLLSHDLHKAHGRHLHRQELRGSGLKITDLEDDPDLQDAVLSVHHACMLTLGNSMALKLIENHLGVAHVKLGGQMQVRLPIQMPTQPTSPPAQPAPQAPQTMPLKGLTLWNRIVLAFRLLLGR